MKAFKPILLILICLTFYSFNSDRTFKILFIGNSLTYTNDLPGLVRKVALKKGMKIETEMLAYPNYALIDHWNEEKAQDLISNEKFDLVILQQGPSSQQFGREILIEYGKKFRELCEINNTETAYFMVWPSLEYYNTFDAVIKNHREAARINEALLLPVGEQWKEHFDTTDNFDYYSGDGFHPSEKGSEAAAEIIASELLKWKCN
ncbi:lysophospholipase L1-like esterase [Christiangramia gaetbulicola]|uniref:Lysophospholipase L1-like esterase n=1 Tax=Christiangramia gaetbulicola TaxID=703340 RepID=A0A2T6AEA1_9FLAO|nr:SGNH/GDSL hydrolase family protein [Christiangramia gaetbulicola]PTX42154.1 lysophospholipase L1-like esterase [Christiangramia gaetbulicola]